MYFIDRPGLTGYTNTMSISNTQILNTKARKKAGGFYINNSFITTATIASVTVTNSAALDGHGGVFMIEGFNGRMTISGSTF